MILYADHDETRALLPFPPSPPLRPSLFKIIIENGKNLQKLFTFSNGKDICCNRFIRGIKQKKKPDEVEKIRPHKRNRTRKFTTTLKIGKNYPGKVSKRSIEKRD